MSNEIASIPQEQILKIDRHGIYFINNNGEDDFISFALCYQSISLLAQSEEVCRNKLEIGNEDDYQTFLDKFRSVNVVGVLDDSYSTDVFDLIFVQGLDEGRNLFEFQFDSRVDYEKATATIQALGWHIYRESEVS